MTTKSSLFRRSLSLLLALMMLLSTGAANVFADAGDAVSGAYRFVQQRL